MPTAVRSHSKVNLGLGIGAPRADGFHALATVYQTLELYDVLTVTARPAKANDIRLTSNDLRVPTDNRNTAWKMVALALETLGLSAEVEIHIDKRLPVQGGLGAGSANAVAALVGLEAELGIVQSSRAPSFSRSLRKGWETTNLHRGLESTAFRPAERLNLAAQVGSDVPLFLIGGAILGLDRGQEVYPLPDFEPTWCVVATPEIGVSTPQAFRDWDDLCAAEGLTAEASTDKLNELSRAYASAFAEAIPGGRQGASSFGALSNEGLAGPQESALVRTGISSWIQNDFERVVFPQDPPLAEIKRILAASDTLEAALHASLSGSGSALFGLYLTQGAAEMAKERLKQMEVRSTLTRTLPRKAYWSQMLIGN
jgi:4-diphosphocytidyl-2-C-methyl-D-erythritol kinase